MDGKGLSPAPRSNHSTFDATHQSQSQSQPATSRRPQKKSKKSNNNANGNSSNNNSNVLTDSNGRFQASPPPQQNLEPFPLFNNKSLSMISTIHRLNPHRKVAIGPEVLREADEQATSLQKHVKHLQEQLDKANREKARIHRFLSDLLYTLNGRGYESVQDHEGTFVDLNKCKGETYLELKGRDLKQRVNVRRPGGQEFLLKAVIGNQERAIQSLAYRLESIGRDILLGNRLCIEDNSNAAATHENTKVASLEAEVLQLVNLIEGACQKCPEIYQALRDHYYMNEGTGNELTPRNPVIENLLKKCEQIAGEAQSVQLVDMLSSSTSSNASSGNKTKTRKQNASSSATTSKQKGSKSDSKTKSSAHTKTSSDVSSDTASSTSASTGTSPTQLNIADLFATIPPPPQLPEAIRGGGNNIGEVLKISSNGSRSGSEVSFKHKGISVRVGRPQQPQGMGPFPPGCNGSGESPIAGASFINGRYGGDQPQSILPECSNVSVCPYCQKKFGIEESISEIKSHIEMHIYSGHPTL